LHRVLIGTTNTGDTVLDPFFGTGTTGAVAKRLGRHYIGLERDPDYAAVARDRLASVTPHDRESLKVATSKRAAPRTPFGELVERTLLAPGEVLSSPNGRHSARVRADGSLAAARTTGSIHKVGAELEGAPSCNGWTYWHFKRDGRPVPIDVLRQHLRAERRV
jgi:modification methylase